MVRREAPLKGKKIVITRPRSQAKEIVESIKALGGDAILLPMIEVTTIYDKRKFDDFHRKWDSINLLRDTDLLENYL